MTNVYKVELSGYGAEIVIGSVSEESAQYFINNEIDIEEYSSGLTEIVEVPEELQPFEPGAWFDCDNITHQSGAEVTEESFLNVYDASGKEVFSSSLDIDELDTAGADVTCINEIYISELRDTPYVFKGESNEKGLFFSGEIRTEGEFDVRKLSINYADVEGMNICRSILYDGVEIDNDDSSTSGNFMSFAIICVGDE